MYAQDSDATIFQSWQWHKAWTAAYPDEVYLLVAYRDAEPVAIAPFRQRYSAPGTGGLRFLGSPHADHLALLSRRSVEAERLLLEAALAKGLFLDLECVSVGSRLHTILQSCAGRSRYRYREIDGIECPYLDLQAWPQCRRKGLANSLRRLRRQLEKQACCHVRHLHHREEMLPLLETFFYLHNQRWHAPRRFAPMEYAQRRELYRQLVEALAPDRVVMSVLYVGYAIAAISFGFIERNVFYYYTPTFNLKYKKHSPGLLLLNDVIDYAAAQGCSFFDLGRGSEQYKFRFGADAYAAHRLQIGSGYSRFRLGRYMAALQDRFCD